MGKKRDKKTARANEPSSIKIARSFLNNHDQEHFKWAIRSDKVDCQHEYLGFNKNVQRIFIENIKPTLDSYSRLKWKEVHNKKHCHYWDIDKLEKNFQNRIIELFDTNGPETLFQININGKHRIFGYVQEGIFYLIGQ